MPVTPPPAIIRIGTIINMPAGVDVTLVVGFGADVPSSYTFQKDTSYLEVTWGKYTSPATFSTVRGELHERGAFVGLKSHRITGEVIDDHWLAYPDSDLQNAVCATFSGLDMAFIPGVTPPDDAVGSGVIITGQLHYFHPGASDWHMVVMKHTFLESFGPM